MNFSTIFEIHDPQELLFQSLFYKLIICLIFINRKWCELQCASTGNYLRWTWNSKTIKSCIKELREVEFSRWQDVKMGLFLSLIIYLGILFLHFCSLHFLFSRVAKCTQEKTIEILSLNYFKLILASSKNFRSNLQNWSNFFSELESSLDSLLFIIFEWMLFWATSFINIVFLTA